MNAWAVFFAVLSAGAWFKGIGPNSVGLLDSWHCDHVFFDRFAKEAAAGNWVVVEEYTQDFFPWARTQPFPQALLAFRINRIGHEHPEHAAKIVQAMYFRGRALIGLNDYEAANFYLSVAQLVRADDTDVRAAIKRCGALDRELDLFRENLKGAEAALRKKQYDVASGIYQSAMQASFLDSSDKLHFLVAIAYCAMRGGDAVLAVEQATAVAEAKQNPELQDMYEEDVLGLVLRAKYILGSVALAGRDYEAARTHFVEISVRAKATKLTDPYGIYDSVLLTHASAIKQIEQIDGSIQNAKIEQRVAEAAGQCDASQQVCTTALGMFESCAPSDTVCCPGGGYCPEDATCCVSSSCAPQGHFCCPTGSSCPWGWHCVEQGQSCVKSTHIGFF